MNFAIKSLAISDLKLEVNRDVRVDKALVALV